MSPVTIEKMNKEIRAWSKDTRKDLVKEFDRLNIQHVARSPSPQPSKDVLTVRAGERQGVVSVVSFKFPRHMVFVHKGVGKGVKANSNVRTSRKAKEWFNTVMNDDVEKLADVVASNQADMVINNFRIK